MLAMMLLCYVLLIKRNVEIYTAALLTMAVFILFNAVLFNHYMNWFVPLIVFVAWDHFNTAHTSIAQASA
jgi:hypothetical protein